MKIAFLSDADTPHPFVNVAMYNGLQWHEVNSIEAIAAAIGANVWHGRSLTPELVAEFQSRDALFVNLKWPLWDLVPALCKLHPCVIGYQENASDYAGMLPAAELEKYLRATRAVRHLFVYDRRAIGYFKALGAKSVSYLPLPAPLTLYNRRRVAWDARPDDPVRIAVAPPVSADRGTYLSILLAARIAPGCRIVCQARDAEEVNITSRLIAELGCLPDCRICMEWARSSRGESFLDRLSRCRLGVNLDTKACYGRFVVDCAGLGIPCIGSPQTAVQADLFPDLTFDGYREMERAIRAGREAMQNAELALTRLKNRYSVSRVRRWFADGIGLVGLVRPVGAVETTKKEKTACRVS